MTAVWEIPPYNTDEDAWRERIEAKSAEQHRLWAIHKAAENARYSRPPRNRTKPAPKRPKATAQPCTDCGRMTRPPGATVEDWPGTIKRRRNGKCYRCDVRPHMAGERVCKRDGCDTIIPAGSDGHREYCSDQCRHRASNPEPKTRIVCKWCGVTFIRKPSERREYCTKTCYHRASNAQKAARVRTRRATGQEVAA